MERVPEPKLMLEPEQVRAYAEADFDEPHGRLIELLLARLDLPESGVAIDLGCGPGDIALRLARALPGWQVDGVDGSRPMLESGRRRLVSEGLAERVRLLHCQLPTPTLPRPAYDLVLSNSLLHHLSEPGVLWSTARAALRDGGALFVMDLMRPESPEAVEALVARHARGEPEILRRDFRASLRAAWRVDEVRAQLAEAGLEALRVEPVSDRHWIAWGGAARVGAEADEKSSL